MDAITLEIPAGIAAQIKLPPRKARKMLMEELVTRLYEQGIITSGQGAELLGMNRLRFERFLAENEVAIHAEPRTLASDLDALDVVP